MMFKLKINQPTTLHTKYGNAKLTNDGYYLITSAKENNNGKLWHRLIFEDFYGKIPKGCIIHHKDKNKSNPCIMNLQLLTDSKHRELHMLGNNIAKGLIRSEETCKKMSIHQNTSGYFRVNKSKTKNCKQGFIWRYGWYENGKKKTITRANIDDLEKAVKEKGLRWEKY